MKSLARGMKQQKQTSTNITHKRKHRSNISKVVPVKEAAEQLGLPVHEVFSFMEWKVSREDLLVHLSVMEGILIDWI